MHVFRVYDGPPLTIEDLFGTDETDDAIDVPISAADYELFIGG